MERAWTDILFLANKHDRFSVFIVRCPAFQRLRRFVSMPNSTEGIRENNALIKPGTDLFLQFSQQVHCANVNWVDYEINVREFFVEVCVEISNIKVYGR
jgi:hypothetical protein